MPKNKGKGGKNRKKGKNDALPTKRELFFKEEGQDYGIITKMLGNCNMNVECSDGTQRLAHVRGSMRKKVWMKTQDTILLSLRDFQDNKADIIHVFDTDEVRLLKSYGELPEKWGNAVVDHDPNRNASLDVDDDEDGGVVFSIDEI